ncbi:MULTISPECIES: universal stress protein [Pedobacter]|uniref:Nucleotide-binding universal stress UspA family protein n=1 Tax=Pedobacter cryoconitis TaxID=188932 RepID=A0A327S0F6_9SPHI|nr:universal stress protein [Pedobacter cryoconitis]MBB5638388.1 nucleotide-binding universal stress UspA family protein [Pedobacter cryoconitis]RAJ22590.1 nucleotide-binding universal stress UspA family protein [Pedobacter cryoconitis]
MKTSQDSDHTKTILVLTDFTKSALNATDYALFLAVQLKTNMLLFHSYYISGSEFESSQIVDYELLAQISKLNLEKEMNRLNTVINADTKNFKPRIDYLSEGGGVVENVCSIIDKKKDILMLVMSGFKSHSNDDVLFGTEITEVVSKARCPAVIVPEIECLRL